MTGFSVTKHFTTNWVCDLCALPRAFWSSACLHLATDWILLLVLWSRAARTYCYFLSDLGQGATVWPTGHLHSPLTSFSHMTTLSFVCSAYTRWICRISGVSRRVTQTGTRLWNGTLCSALALVFNISFHKAPSWVWSADSWHEEQKSNGSMWMFPVCLATIKVCYVTKEMIITQIAIIIITIITLWGFLFIRSATYCIYCTDNIQNISCESRRIIIHYVSNDQQQTWLIHWRNFPSQKTLFN